MANKKNSPPDDIKAPTEPTLDAATQSVTAEAEPVGDIPPEPLVTPTSADSIHAPDTSKKLWLALAVLGVVLVGLLGTAVVSLNEAKQNQQLALAEAEQAKTMAAELATQLKAIKDALQGQQGEVERMVSSRLEQTLQEQRASAEQTLAQQNAALSEIQMRLNGHQNRLAELSETSREDWKLAEAEYLLKLANQRVLLEKSPTNAVALLEATDKIIGDVAAGLGDPELFAIRKALAKELTALRLITPIDRDGLYLQLQALADEADSLPVKRESTLNANPNTAIATDEQGGLWSEIKSIFGSMNQYIKIESAAAPASPLLDAHAAQMTALNVRVLIQQAQVALLKEQPVVYQNSLSTAISLVTSHYPDTEKVINYTDSLRSMLAKTIVMELPDISQSLKLLHAYIEQTHQLPANKEAKS